MLRMGKEDIRGEFPGSGGKSDEHQKPGKEGDVWEGDGVEGKLSQEERVWDSILTPNRNRSVPVVHLHPHHYHHRGSLLPLQWRITHSFYWKTQVLSSTLSLIAFLLLLVMTFSKRWLWVSKSRFHQRWPVNVSHRIYTSAQIMSLGLLQICKSKSCSNSENGKDSFKLWINHPVFGVAKITFCLALALGFIFTFWLHLPYVPGFQRLPFFGWIGTIMSFCEVTFTFFTLILFPINIWIFELKRNLSIPIGWSYFIGWVVFVLYVTCAFLCYFNNKNFWSLILSHSFNAVSCSNCARLGCLNEQIVSDTSVDQEEKQEETSL